MKFDPLLNEMEHLQQQKLLKNAQRIVPQVTSDDLLQPNDFPELENHPEFRYEEGVLHGIQMVKMALQRAFRDEEGKLASQELKK